MEDRVERVLTVDLEEEVMVLLVEGELMVDTEEKEEVLVEELFGKEVLFTQTPFLYCLNLHSIRQYAVFTFTFSMNPT